MAKTFMQLADKAFAQAHSVSAEDALQEFRDHPNALLVDVRDVEEVQATGLGVGAGVDPLSWTVID